VVSQGGKAANSTPSPTAHAADKALPSGSAKGVKRTEHEVTPLAARGEQESDTIQKKSDQNARKDNKKKGNKKASKNGKQGGKKDKNVEKNVKQRAAKDDKGGKGDKKHNGKNKKKGGKGKDDTNKKVGSKRHCKSSFFLPPYQNDLIT
jgi:hypothetical protein